MKHRNSHLLIGYWSRLGRGRHIPDQADIDPRAIKRMLPNVFILDADDAARPAYRLAGTLLCERFGQELRGTNFFGQWEATACETLEFLVRRALHAKQAVCLSAIGTTSQCATIEMETILAPLTFGSGTPRRFLGITQFLGDAASLGGRPITCERLIGSAAIRESDPSSHPAEPPPAAPTIMGSQRLAPKSPHLRLVVSQDKPAALRCGADDAMGKLIATLDIAPAVRLVR